MPWPIDLELFDRNKFWSRLVAPFQSVSVEGAWAGVGHSILVGSPYVKTEQARIACLKLDLLVFATVGPLAVSTRSATLFLVYDIEKVWSEDVWPIGTTSSLLVNTSWISPLVFHLHIVGCALLALRNAILLSLCLQLYGQSSIYWCNLSRIVHINLVHSVVGLVGTVHLPEDKSAKRRVADSFPRFVASNCSLQGSVNLHTRKRQSELIQVRVAERVGFDCVWNFLLSLIHLFHWTWRQSEVKLSASSRR